MIKRIGIIISVLLLTVVSLYVAYALTNPTISILNVVETGETNHGEYRAELHETGLSEAESGYMGRITYETDLGYYVKNFKVSFNGNNLDLGFEAGAETGNFFRKYAFSPLRDNYEFIIPNNASNDNKVDVDIEYAKKTAFDISYMNYTKNEYDDDHVYDINNYGEEKVLVKNYMDGDLVLPEDCSDNGCVLAFKFKNSDDLNEYKNVVQEEPDRSWFSVEAVVDNENFLEGGEDSCDEESNTCYVLVKNGFKNLSYGNIHFGYTNIGVYTEDYLGFDVETDIDNFNDIISETGSSTIGFNESKKEADIELFYGTREIRLIKKEIKPIVNGNKENNTGSVRNFTNVKGSGYGYDIRYVDDIAIITLNTYYQDKLTLEFNILDGNKDVIGGKVKINLSRFAFAGNGGQLLEVDEKGRNCKENNNGNTCDKGIYYSTQYRGILSFMYINENEEEKEFNSLYKVTNITSDSIEVEESPQETGYKRNKGFNPHAIALFYDENDMIVGTKDFDLNKDIDMDGFVKKSVFNDVYSKYHINRTIDKDYVFFDHEHPTTINNLDYFGHHTEETIMHDIVIISKDEVQEKGIKKIALFLVNGEIAENEIPALTYGIGEGRIMEIFGGEE